MNPWYERHAAGARTCGIEPHAILAEAAGPLALTVDTERDGRESRLHFGCGALAQKAGLKPFDAP